MRVVYWNATGLDSHPVNAAHMSGASSYPSLWTLGETEGEKDMENCLRQMSFQKIKNDKQSDLDNLTINKLSTNIPKFCT